MHSRIFGRRTRHKSLRYIDYYLSRLQPPVVPGPNCANRRQQLSCRILNLPLWMESTEHTCQCARIRQNNASSARFDNTLRVFRVASVFMLCSGRWTHRSVCECEYTASC